VRVRDSRLRLYFISVDLGLDMEPFLRSLDRSPGGLILALAGLVLVLSVSMGVLAVNVRNLRRRWTSLMSEANGQNLETLLERHLVERQSFEDRLTDSRERVETLERKMRSAKRYVGLVKYDAFDDVGGNQSFALAFYDEEGNGVVLTSQVGREGCRVYGKSLANGKAERHLSTEEEMAIEQGTAVRSRPRISP
jgi:uncharacterized protein DUF4446